MKADFDIMKAVSGITMNVRIKGMKQFRFRLWCGKTLISLATFIMGIGIKVNEESY